MWKDVVGENIDFKISIPNWKDLPDNQKTELKELETNIMTTIGPSFKVLENNIKDKNDKIKFVQY